MPPNNVKKAEDYKHDDIGTPGSKAPEQGRLLPAGDDGTKKMMSSKTNVWGIGMIIRSLVTCFEGLAEDLVPKHHVTNSQFHEAPDFDATAREYYSDELLSLIRSCVRYNDEERPTFDEIMAKIQDFTCGDFDMTEGLRDLPPNDPRWTTARNRLLFARPNPWRQNMLLVDAPVRDGGGTLPDPPPEDDVHMYDDDLGGEEGTEVVPPYVTPGSSEHRSGGGYSGSAGAGASGSS